METELINLRLEYEDNMQRIKRQLQNLRMPEPGHALVIPGASTIAIERMRLVEAEIAVLKSTIEGMQRLFEKLIGRLEFLELEGE